MTCANKSNTHTHTHTHTERKGHALATIGKGMRICLKNTYNFGKDKKLIANHAKKEISLQSSNIYIEAEKLLTGQR